MSRNILRNGGNIIDHTVAQREGGRGGHVPPPQNTSEYHVKVQMNIVLTPRNIDLVPPRANFWLRY